MHRHECRRGTHECVRHKATAVGTVRRSRLERRLQPRLAALQDAEGDLVGMMELGGVETNRVRDRL